VSLNARLQMRQGQALVITPQLQQAIKLLQYTNLELDAYLDAEMEKNPLLVREDSEGEISELEAAPSDRSELVLDEAPGGRAEAELDAAGGDLHGDAAPGERATGEMQADGAPDSALAGDGGGAVDWSRADRNGATAGDGEDLDFGAAREKTLREHLADQLSALRATPAERAVGVALIDGLDEGGYLRADLAEVADRLGCGLALVEAMLARVQRFDPTGVFARSVGECLALQLAELGRLDPCMKALTEHLDLLSRRDYAALKRICGVDDEDLHDMLAELRRLTPRPGAAFGGEPMQPVIPDVLVREDGAGLWRVELNGDTLPRVLVDQRYHARISGGARTEADRIFVGECLAQASWLVRSLDQRARTILKVAGEIVRQQDAFLAYGVGSLRPMNLKVVADAVGVHESTVSRVTSNKYIATPRGVFELKFFFTAALGSSQGGATHSAEAVRHRLRQLVDGERAPSEVLSDDRLVEMLRDCGIDIARRTVAKYRDALRIPSSSERRRRFEAARFSSVA